jgi:hypothetical protein
MNQDQLTSIIRSILKIVGAILVARGLNVAANLVNTEDCVGLAVTLAGLALSHYSHKPISPAIKP